MQVGIVPRLGHASLGWVIRGFKSKISSQPLWLGGTPARPLEPDMRSYVSHT